MEKNVLPAASGKTSWCEKNSLFFKKLSLTVFVSVFVFLLSFKVQAQGFSNITITNSATSGGGWNVSTAGPYVFTPTNSTANINVADIQNRLVGTNFTPNNITINTAFSGGSGTGNVTFSAPITAPTTSTTAVYTFTVNAGGNIAVNSNSSINLVPAAASKNNAFGNPASNITLNAGSTGSVTISSSIDVSGGVGQTPGKGKTQEGGAGGIISIFGSAGVSLNASLKTDGGANDPANGFGIPGKYIINDGSGTVTISGNNDGQSNGSVMSGAGVFTKTGSGIFNILGNNTFSGGLIISAGTIQLGAAERLNNVLPVSLNGGTLRTGATTGFTETVGTLALTDNSTIALGTGSHTLTFAASNSTMWTSGKTLTITGWTGSYNGISNATAGKIFIGTSGSGLTFSQLSQIRFYDGNNFYPALILPSGEIVPTPITTGSISGPPCISSTINVPFNYTLPANFPSATFTAQLSNASGSFTSAVNLQSVASDGTGSQSITVTIPSNTTQGSGYLIRVISSNPLANGRDNGTGLSVNALPADKTVAAASSAVCSGTSTNITVALSISGVSYQLRNNTNNTLIGTAVVGNGGTINLSTGNLTTATTFNVLATNASGCTAQMTNTPTVTVSPTSVGGTVAGSTTVCTGTNNGTLTLSGQTGSITKWQSSTVSTFGSNVTDIANTTNSLTFNNLTATTYYRAVVTSGTCSFANSSTATVTVNPTSVGGTIAGDTTFCTGTNSGTLTLSGQTGSITRWQSSTANNFSTNVTDIANTTNSLTYSNLSFTTYYRAVVTSGACSSKYSSTATITVNAAGNTWKGITSTAWNVDDNWTCKVPTASANIIIASAPNMPTLDKDRTVGNFTLQSGTIVTLNGNVFTVDGNVTGTGKLKSDKNSSLVLNGTNTSGTLYFDQTKDSISNVLKDFTVNTTGTFNLGSNLYIVHELAPNKGTLNINTGDTLTIRSTSIANTARVAHVGASAQINGNVTVERYIPKRRAYRLLSPAVTTTTSINANWMEGGRNNSIDPPFSNPHHGFGTNITGPKPADNGFDQTRTTNPSLFTFNTKTQKFDSVPNTKGILEAGKGYSILVRGDRNTDMRTNNPDTSNTILRATGTLFKGTYSPDLSDSSGKYTLIGNPYASPVDFTKMWNDPGTKNVRSTYTAFDPRLARRGAYAQYNASTDAPLPAASDISKDIQPGQAVFVQTDEKGSASIDFKEEFKSTGNTELFGRDPHQFTKLSVQLLLNLDEGMQNIADGVIAFFDKDFSTVIGNEDSYKFTNPDENLAISRSGTSLSIEGRPEVTANDTVLLRMWQFRQKSYYLKLNGSNFSPDVTAFIKDNYLNEETPVSLLSETLFPFSIDSVAASFAKDRFSIVFKPGTTLPVTLTDIKAYQKENGIQVDWTAESENNIESYEVEKSADGRQFGNAAAVPAKGNNAITQNYGWFDTDPAIGSNFYRIKVTDKSGVVKYSNTVKVDIAEGKSSITVSPNPVKDNVIKMQFSNLEKGKYAVVLYNTSGQRLYSSTIDHTARSGNYTISSVRLISKGIYTLHISKGNVEINKRIVVE